MPKKQKNDPHVRLGQLVGLIIAVVQALDRQRAGQTEQHVYHVTPHCDGCTCMGVDGNAGCCKAESRSSPAM